MRVKDNRWANSSQVLSCPFASFGFLALDIDEFITLASDSGIEVTLKGCAEYHVITQDSSGLYTRETTVLCCDFSQTKQVISKVGKINNGIIDLVICVIYH